MINFYELFGIKENSTKSQIKQAYSKVIKTYNCESTESYEMLEKITEAKDILLNDVTKSEYDNALHEIRHSKQFSKKREETYEVKLDIYRNEYKEAYVTKKEIFKMYMKYSKSNKIIKILKSILILINFLFFLIIKGIIFGILFILYLLGECIDYITGIFMLLGVLSLFLLTSYKSPDYIPFIPANIEMFFIISILVFIIQMIKIFTLEKSLNLYALSEDVQDGIFIKIILK